MSSSHPLSISSSSPSPDVLDGHDESVRIAIRALGDMRNGGPQPQKQPSSSTSHSLQSQSPSGDVDAPDFVYRVSHLPIVTSALRAYSQGKASSRVVKYGAEMMESSIQTMARPVIDRLPNVNQLDEFACRQLDRFGGRYHRPSDSDHAHDDIRGEDRSHPVSRSAPTRDSPLSLDQDDTPNTRGARQVPGWLQASGPFVPAPPPPPDSRSPTPHPTDPTPSQPDHERTDLQPHDTNNEQQQQLTNRTGWQSVLLEAGGFSAALSEESMRRLKYCLHWLQYATTHIDAQILILRDFTTTLQPIPSSSFPATHAQAHTGPISPAHMRTLTDVRRDVVHTIRQVVDVVSKYAGGALPEPARTRVRGFILKLPQRWASAAGASSSGVGASIGVPVTSGVGSSTGTEGRKRNGRYQHHRERSTSLSVPGSGKESPGSSRAASPMSSTRITRSSLAVGNPHHTAPPTAGAAVQAAQRILTLATESLDMMRGVTGVVKDSLDRADAWVGRLRVVGLQRGAHGADGDGDRARDGREQEWRQEDVPVFGGHRHAGIEGDDDTDASHTRSHSYSSSTLSSLSSVPSTPYSVPGTPAPASADAPSPGVVMGIGGLSLSMVRRRGEFGGVGRHGEQEKAREEEGIVDMEIDG